MGPLLIKPAEMMLFYTGADRLHHEAENQYLMETNSATKSPQSVSRNAQ